MNEKIYFKKDLFLSIVVYTFTYQIIDNKKLSQNGNKSKCFRCTSRIRGCY